jgi:hypothetical protein
MFCGRPILFGKPEDVCVKCIAENALRRLLQRTEDQKKEKK